MLLSDIKIKNSKCKPKSYKLFDGEGLQVLVHPNGSKYWQYKYRFFGKEKLLSIGKYPAVSLSQARLRKTEAQELLRRNIDPSKHKRETKMVAAFRNRNSFEIVAKEWYDKSKDLWVKQYADSNWSRLQNHVFPELGHRPVAEIKSLELLGVLQKIEERGNTSMCRTIRGMCGRIFRYAIVTGRAEHNPAVNLVEALKPHRAVSYRTITARELPAFLADFESTRCWLRNRLAFKFLLLTAVRTGEMRTARWQDFDLEKREWRIPAELMKMRRDHIVPLSRQCLEVLVEIRKLNGDKQYLFASSQTRKQELITKNIINVVIVRMGWGDRIVGHGFRSLFSTIMNENGFNWDAVERQLAHVEQNGVRAAYNRAEYLEERHTMMQWWADYLEKAGLIPTTDNRVSAT